MMTNSITLSTSTDLVDTIANLKPIRLLAEMYSGLMEETITPRFTLHLLNVQAAAFMTIMPVDLPVLTHVLCLFWFVTSICLAKRAYSNK